MMTIRQLMRAAEAHDPEVKSLMRMIREQHQDNHEALLVAAAKRAFRKMRMLQKATVQAGPVGVKH